MSDLSTEDDRPPADRFVDHRDRLFGIAYRMTGSVADAEDCVQDAYLRWVGADRTTVENDEAFLVRIVSRLAIDRLRSSARNRETYVGPWLPEPLVGPVGSASEGAELVELADSLTLAFLVLLDRLSAAERATIILHDVFAVPFDEVAVVLGREVSACRQLASRARRKLHEVEPPPRADSPTVTGEVMADLLTAIMAGDIDQCMDRLAPGVVLTSDAGPARRAARRHVVGPERVARLVLNLFRRDAELVSGLEPVMVNGSLGILVRHAEGPLVLSVDLDSAGLVQRVWIQMNPDKLARALPGHSREADH